MVFLISAGCVNALFSVLCIVTANFGFRVKKKKTITLGGCQNIERGSVFFWFVRVCV